LSQILPAKSAKISEISESAITKNKTASIRVSPNNYFSAFLLGIFFAGFFIYLEKDFWAIPLLVFSFVILPVLAWTDRIEFDGKRIVRTGVLPRAWAWLNNYHFRLKLTDIEQVETQALRALKRGGNVFYRYRTTLNGRDLKFVIASGGEQYRRMVQAIFPRLSENILDNRSIELRDYIAEPKETLMKAEFVHIPSADVLEDSFKGFEKHGKKNLRQPDIVEGDLEKAEYMRRLGNELRLSGYLLQALEAFRRALVIKPQDARLLFEFAR
jgi:hypothetical protein